MKKIGRIELKQSKNKVGKGLKYIQGRNSAGQFNDS